MYVYPGNVTKGVTDYLRLIAFCLIFSQEFFLKIFPKDHARMDVMKFLLRKTNTNTSSILVRFF